MLLADKKWAHKNSNWTYDVRFRAVLLFKQRSMRFYEFGVKSNQTWMNS